MNYNRRDFLKKTVGAATGVALSSSLLGLSCKSEQVTWNFGIQLWSVKDDVLKDPKDVIKKLASFGYKQLETFEGEKGLWWGMSPTEYKTFQSDLGLTTVSAHADIRTNFEQKVEEAANIGLDYLICPWVGPQESLDAFKKIAETFNEKGEICKKAGIKFGYHNHDYGFIPLEGQLPQDVIMENTDPDLVEFEMDMYWVVTGGADPIEWIKKYPGRFKLAHVKDRMKESTDHQASCVIGTGSIDYAKLIAESKALGMKYFIVEQERFDAATPMESAKLNAQYLSTLKV